MRTNTTDRFFDKVDKNTANGCWNWTGCLTHDGYGRFWYNGKTVLAHRFSYEYVNGPIISSLTCDHLCRNRLCVNPAHIELVTSIENIHRGHGNYKKTHCKHGHEFTPDNTQYNPRTNKRCCKACSSESSRKYLYNPENYARIRKAQNERRRAKRLQQ